MSGHAAGCGTTGAVVYQPTSGVRHVGTVITNPTSARNSDSAFVEFDKDGSGTYLYTADGTKIYSGSNTSYTITSKQDGAADGTAVSMTGFGEQAIVNTLKSSEYEFEQDLINKMISETRGYPYFIQFYGYFTIENTSKKKLALSDFTKIREKLLKELDKNFFVDRLNLASGREKQILFAMAKIGESDIETSKIKSASRMDKHVMLELIKRLIEKGLIYRSDRGKYGFSLSLFRDFLLRTR